MGAPTPEQKAVMDKLSAERKIWLKKTCEALGSSEKKLTKELAKLAKKATPAAPKAAVST